jgi:hypothetical protein
VVLSETFPKIVNCESVTCFAATVIVMTAPPLVFEALLAVTVNWPIEFESMKE